VYLSGGNTYIFLDSANKRGLKKILQKVLDSEGLLIGASAGSLMMTPTIELAKSENSISLQDSSGFNFVPFEFFPHYTALNKGFPEGYVTSNTIYLCKDGDGIFVSDSEVKMFGDISEI
jgi:dipeptidase E